MKQIRLFLIGIVLTFAGTAHATDILKVQDVEVAIGESVTLSIELENETMNLMGWQCDIVLPEGLSLALKNNGKPAAMLGERFATTEHSITSSRLANGAYRFIATSMDGEAIPGNSGTLFTVTLQADAALARLQRLGGSPTIMQSLEASPTNGQLQSLEASPTTGKVTNIEFNTQDNQKLTFEEVTINITILPKEQQKCAIPTIAYDKGELVFSCETEGVKYVSEVKVADAKGYETERVTLTPTYVITVYATKEEFGDSDVATSSIRWRNGRPVFEGFSSVTLEAAEDAGDVNGDGEIGIGDIVAITNIMAGKQ